MFEMNDKVRDKDTGEEYFVVAPYDSEDDLVVVWLDSTNTKIILLPYEEVEVVPTDKQMFSRMAITVQEEGEGFQVNRNVRGIGVEPVVAAYAEMRKYIEELTKTPIAELDKILMEQSVEEED